MTGYDASSCLSHMWARRRAHTKPKYKNPSQPVMRHGVRAEGEMSRSDAKRHAKARSPRHSGLPSRASAMPTPLPSRRALPLVRMASTSTPAMRQHACPAHVREDPGGGVESWAGRRGGNRPGGHAEIFYPRCGFRQSAFLKHSRGEKTKPAARVRRQAGAGRRNLFRSRSHVEQNGQALKLSAATFGWYFQLAQIGHC